MVFIYLIIFSHFIELFFSKSFSVDSSGLPMYIIIASAINKSLFLFNIYTLNFYFCFIPHTRAKIFKQMLNNSGNSSSFPFYRK